jgi:hypothetical protein
VLFDKTDKTGRDFERYLAIGADLYKERLFRKRLTCDSIGEMKDLFEDEDV